MESHHKQQLLQSIATLVSMHKRRRRLITIEASSVRLHTVSLARIYSSLDHLTMLKNLKYERVPLATSLTMLENSVRIRLMMIWIV